MASIILRANNSTESSSKESQLMNQLMMLLIIVMLMERMMMVTRCMVEDCFLRTGKHSISPAWWLCTRVDDCHDKNMAIEKPLLSFAMRFPILQARQCSILIKREAPEHSKTIQVANFNIPGNPIQWLSPMYRWQIVRNPPKRFKSKLTVLVTRLLHQAREENVASNPF